MHIIINILILYFTINSNHTKKMFRILKSAFSTNFIKIPSNFPFQVSEKPPSYYYSFINPNSKRVSDYSNIGIVLPNVLPPHVLQSFKCAVYETYLALINKNDKFLEFMLEPNLYNKIHGSNQNLEMQLDIPKNGINIGIPYFAKHETITGLNLDRSKNLAENQYFRINKFSFRALRKYVYIQKSNFVVSLNKILRIDALITTNFDIEIKDTGFIKKSKYSRMWSFETLFENQNFPIVFPENHQFDKLLYSSKIIGKDEEFAKYHKNLEQKINKMSAFSLEKYKLMHKLTIPNKITGAENLHKFYFENKDFALNKPNLIKNGWKIIDIDYLLNGNPLILKP